MNNPGRTETTFNLHDLLEIQKNTCSIDEPHYYTAADAGVFKTSVTPLDGEEFNIETSISQPFVFDSNSPTASHLRHDFVANKVWGGTDQSMELLGIPVNLTPDAINVRERKVLELATTIANDREGLNIPYNAKRISYEEILKAHSAFLYIMVVSPTHVLTNCKLSDSMVIELCMRMRCGLSLERQVESKTGRLLQGNSKSESSKYVDIKRAFNLVQASKLPDTPQFSSKLKTLMQIGLSEEDEHMVQIMIRDSLNKSLGKRERCQRREQGSNLNKCLSDYLDHFGEASTKEDSKRVTNFPIAIMKDSKWDQSRFMPEIISNVSCPEPLFKLWRESKNSLAFMDQRSYTLLKMQAKSEASYGADERMKHDMRRRSVFSAEMSNKDLDYIALSGPGAKLRAEIDEVRVKEAESKKSFSPMTNVQDVDTFINSDLFTYPIDADQVQDHILEGICAVKNKVHLNAESAGIFRGLRQMQISQHASLITDICTELAYEYKIPNRSNQWGLKILRNSKTMLLYRSTSSHVFFSLALFKGDCQILDPGRIGPSMYEVNDYYITDFSSISEDGLDHFVKALPYTMSLLPLVMQTMEIPLPQENVCLPESYWQTIKTVYLLYLNNKLDSEEIVTSVRYLYMNLFQESFSDVSVFVDKLPEVLRSRLSVYLLNRVISLMQFYDTNRLKRYRIRDQDGKHRYKFMSVKSIFSTQSYSMTQLINSFYYGYVVSKSRGKIGERNIKVLKKIMSEEMWFNKEIVGKGICLWEPQKAPLKHCWRPELLKYMVRHHVRQMQTLYGGGFFEILEHDLLRAISECTFLEVSTLKASSKEEDLKLEMPDGAENMSHRDLKEALLRMNKGQQGKRPRVITQVFKTVAEYIKDTGNTNPKLIDVSVWSLNQLNSKGYFVSDCFSKDQHGGDREIHVLHIKARLAQFIFEQMNGTICKYFPHDSIMNPGWKDTYFKDHQRRAQDKLGDHYTMCKSADAAKWCQRHHSSMFFAIISLYVPIYMLQFCYVLMHLWNYKRIILPPDVISNFVRNANVKSTNEFYIAFKGAYYSGSAPFFSDKQRNIVTCQSGMWQGILHRASTLKHSIIQNFWASYTREYLTNQKLRNEVDVIQGSDDSAALISVSDTRKEVVALLEILLDFKEQLAEYISIWSSEAKSSIGCLNLVEYNSEWIVDGRIIKPTARWALACLETTLVEKFSSRLDIYYGVLSQTLESGGTTFLCALTQMCQSYMHYMLLGLRNHILGEEVMLAIIDRALVALGFFPLDSDLNAGLTGFDYLMYSTHRIFNVPTHSYDVEEVAPSAIVEYNDKTTKDMRRDINSSRIAFGKYYLWNKLIQDAEIKSLDTLLEEVDQNPRSLYVSGESWKENHLTCSLKLYQPGVKTSLSSYQPNIRMMCASSYIISRQCITLPFKNTTEKFSLFKLLRLSSRYYNAETLLNKSSLSFPHQSEYSEFFTYMQDVLKTYFYQPADLQRVDKTRLLLWGSEMVAEVPLMNMCIRQWFGVKVVKISSTMFNHLWAQTKVKYTFLRDTCHETAQATGLNNIELFFFIQTLAKRVKHLKLQDTSSRETSKEEVVTRIYWPGIKLRSSAMKEFKDVSVLRTFIFSAMTFPFERFYRADLIRKLIFSCPILSSSYEVVPRRAKKLKIFHDFLRDGNVLDLIARIQEFKRGVVGFFSIRQGDSGKYSGRGQWVGRVCDVPCKIDMEDGVVTRILLNRLTDLIELSNALRSLIQEFKLRLPDMPAYTPHQIYLNEMGKFEHSKMAVPHTVSLFFDTSYKVDVFDELANYNWKFRVTQNKLRITCIPKDAEDDKHELTVLSDTFTASDWVEGCQSPIEVTELFECWAQGRKASIKQLLEATGYSVTDMGFESMMSDVRARRKTTRGNIDVKLASHWLREHIASRYSSGSTGDLGMIMKDDVSSSAVTHDSSLLYHSLVSFETPLLQVIQEMTKEESGIPSIDAIMDSSSSEDPEFSAFERLKDIFFEVDWTAQDELDRKIKFQTTMSGLNKFFRNLDEMIEVAGISEHLEKIACSQSYTVSDLDKIACDHNLRHILSFALQIKVPGLRLDVPASFIEAKSDAEDTLSSFSHDYLITKDASTLRETIDQLSNLLPMVTGELHSKFTKLLRKYQVELAAVNSMGEHTSLSYLSYWSFIDVILREFSEKGIWQRNIMNADVLTLRTILISDCLDVIMSSHALGKVSDMERDELAASAWPEIVSTGLVNLLSKGCHCNITIKLNHTQVYKTAGPSTYSPLTISFSDAQRRITSSQVTEGMDFARKGSE